MAARGAQSRKVLNKTIQKEEEKRHMQEETGRSKFQTAPMSGHPTHGLRHLFSPSQKSRSTRGPSYAASYHLEDSDIVRAGFHTTSERSYSRISAKGGSRSFISGRDTNALRGRSWSAPVKASIASRAATLHSSAEDQMPLSPMDPCHTRTEPQMRVWHGHGRAPEVYPGLGQDSDMWMDDGDCHIFFSDDTDDEPHPTFRLHVQQLESAKSTFLSNILRYGEIFQAEDLTPPSSAAGRHGVLSPDSLTDSDLGHLTNGIGSSHAEPSKIFFGSPLQSSTPTPERLSGVQNGKLHKIRDPNELTPPMSAAASDTASSSGRSHGPVQITHEIWFKAPSHLKDHYVRYRHHIATRNFLALLYGKALVGSDYWEMISDLHNVMDTYYELNDPDQRIDSAKCIIRYLSEKRLDDVRNNLSNALGLLAWCEQPSVHWDEGYTETFVHCVGMLSQEDLASAEFRNLSRVSRHNLEVAWTNLQLKILEAEENLAGFDFADMWQVGMTVSDSPVRKSFEHCRGFLSSFYEHVYGQWPPPKNHTGHWLTRDIARRLQEDFGAMYDYLVDRDVAWDASEERHTRKWEIVCNIRRTEGFTADIAGLPFTDMLVSFDLRYKYAHIPHPYPLLPHSTQTHKEKSAKRALFGGLKKAKAAASQFPKEQFQMSLAFSGATNINKFGVTFDENTLIDALTIYEKTTQLNGVTPLHARLGRWLLLYAILQVLSTISVDTAGLKYKDKVSYFLCPSLEGCPPWRRHGLPHPYVEAEQRRSYCWVAPQMWRRPGEEPRMLLGAAGLDEEETSGSERRGEYVGRPGTLKPELPMRESTRLSMGLNIGRERTM